MTKKIKNLVIFEKKILSKQFFIIESCAKQIIYGTTGLKFSCQVSGFLHYEKKTEILLKVALSTHIPNPIVY
jgi:hypothetical protein